MLQTVVLNGTIAPFSQPRTNPVSARVHDSRNLMQITARLCVWSVDIPHSILTLVETRHGARIREEGMPDPLCVERLHRSSRGHREGPLLDAEPAGLTAIALQRGPMLVRFPEAPQGVDEASIRYRTQLPMEKDNRAVRDESHQRQEPQADPDKGLK